MNTIGIRAKPGGVTFAVLDAQDRRIANVETIKLPKALLTPDALKYIRNNILDIIREYEISRAGLRVTESTAQTLSVSRIEIEGVIQEAFASSSLNSYYCGQISTIASRVGIARADFKPYVDGTKIFDGVENWNELRSEEREAVFAALGAVNA
ncbi:hypothetical protein [Rhodanobacter ginsenosidimutans]|uniref:Uncharacterized protein n=1 Tax=Rhodanobacter ginsenosidimutans TaxID=490571 RepID=A0ABW0JY41_9GAMM